MLFFSGNSTTATRVYGQGENFSGRVTVLMSFEELSSTNDANHGGLGAESLLNPVSVFVDVTGVYSRLREQSGVILS